MNVDEQVNRRTRFKYMIDDRVRVIATERTGVVEARNPDPEQRPYLVRLDPRTLEEYQQPERATFHEEMLERNLSPAFTVIFEEGARDVYDRAAKRLEAVQSVSVAFAASPEEAAERRVSAPDPPASATRWWGSGACTASIARSRKVTGYLRAQAGTDPATGKPTLSWSFDQEALDAEQATDGWYG